MNLFKKQITYTLISAFALTSMFTACIDDNKSETVITDFNNALITNVSLSSNSKVCYNLNSYAFTIDHLGNSDRALIDSTRSLWQVNEYSLEPGILFNPDSLPVGSIADSIKVSLSYSSPYKVEFFQYDKDLVLQKKTNFADTQIIWFDDYAVTRIQVTASNGSTNKSYFMKINVHTCSTDTIMWKYLCKELFDMNQVIDQRVDTLGTDLYWYTSLADGTQEVRTADLTGDVSQWSEAQSVTAPAQVELGSLVNLKGNLYAVGADHSLLSSNDGIAWQVASTDFAFVNLLGIQPKSKKNDEHFCAIAKQGDDYHFVRSDDGNAWTLDTLIINDDSTSLVPEGFPLYDYTRPISVEADFNSSSTTSRIYISGGMKADSTLTASTWSSDGSTWVEFNQRILPPMKRATIIRYTLDIDNPDSFWIMQTGEMKNGYVSDTLYFSQNSGVTWKKLPREYYRLGDTYRIDPFGCSSGFYNPKDYRIFFIGGKNNNGEQESNIITGQLFNLAMKKRK